MQPLKIFLLVLLCLFLVGERLWSQTKSSPPETENQPGGREEIKVEVPLSEMDWDAEENEDSGTTPASDLQNINWDQEDPEEAAVEDATPGTLDETSTSGRTNLVHSLERRPPLLTLRHRKSGERVFSQEFDAVCSFPTRYPDRIAHLLAFGVGNAAFFQEKERR